MGQLAMSGVVLVLTVAVILLEALRVLLYPFGSTAPSNPKNHLNVCIDGECAVCNALRSFVVFRLRDPAAIEAIAFVPAQKVLKAEDDAARVVAGALKRAKADTSTLLDRLHLIEAKGGAPLSDKSQCDVHVGAFAVLRLFDECHAPYPLAAALGRALPRAAVDAAYEAFSKQRHSWFGRRDLLAPVQAQVDRASQTKLVLKEAKALAALAAVGAVVTVVLRVAF